MDTPGNGGRGIKMQRATRILIVDYGMGNLHSVRKAFEACGGAVALAGDPGEVAAADALVVPGVGSFGDCAGGLARSGMKDAVAGFIRSGRPYLGLCLGLQILFPSSEEAPGVPGLGIIPGRVRRFSGSLKIPHVGWNTIAFPGGGDARTPARGAGVRDPARLGIDPPPAGRCPIFRGVQDGAYVYFAHSFYPEPEDPAVSASATEYGMTFASAIWKDNIIATQFHPEKSQRAGLAMIRNFVAFAAERAAARPANGDEP